MGNEGGVARDALLRDYLRVLARRRWIVLTAVVLLPLAAVLLSLRQEKVFEAAAQVYLTRQNLASTLTGQQDPSLSIQSDRLAATQASLARVRQLAVRTVAATPGASLTAEEFLRASSVTASSNADLLTFRVRDHDRRLAQRLASAYATQFTRFRRDLETAPVKRALAEVDASLAELARAGDRRSALYASLVDKQQQLRTMDALQTTPAVVVESAENGKQVQPRPTRNGILGLVLGVLLGIALAFLWEGLDTRVRRSDEVAERLGLPLLARVPPPPRRIRSDRRLAMLTAPRTPTAEAFRVLQTNLDFVAVDRETKVLMITSALQGEGKTTTIANLGIALARGGKRVILVDLDLRRPYLHRFFEIGGRPGLTQVVLGRAALSEALAPIAIAMPNASLVDGAVGRADGNGGAYGTARAGGNGHAYRNGNGNGNHARSLEGLLEVLHAGPLPPDPGEFVGKRAIGDLLGALRDRADVVLVDAPPLLGLGDALRLSAFVDGIIVATRLEMIRKASLGELGRLLEHCKAPVVGFVATGSGADAEYRGYGYPYAYGDGRERERPRVTA